MKVMYIWILLVLCFDTVIPSKPQWRWECVQDKCQKQRIEPNSKLPITSLKVCQLLCGKYGSLWPKPTGLVTISNSLVPLDGDSIDVSAGRSENVIYSLIRAGIKHFVKQVRSQQLVRSASPQGQKLVVSLNIKDPEITQLTLLTDESYVLEISSSDNRINATITADNYFGSRHGLETLGQLIVYDDILNELKVPSQAFISDKPAYPYRGVLLDTARNYISTDTIKRTIDGLSASKLNTLHWHITDSQSFPYVSPSHPELSEIGAYSESQVYTPQDVEEILRFGLERGVRILPEFDAPAHVGEGWQDTDFVACFNKQPWQEYCVGPPCGQLNPTKDKLYDVLEDLYKDFIQQFNPDLFHMGGDEVSFSCWNSSEQITDWMHDVHGWETTEEGFIKLWNVFQSRALARLDKHTDQKLPIIMWTSTLTKREYVEKYLPKDRYIIQIWTRGDDQQVTDLLQLGYKLILSNYDALYLDCGVSAWVTDGANWCSPYKGWQEIYENSPAKIGGSHANQILGAEAALWTEQVDDTSVDVRIWPRAAAMAERLWSEPDTDWREAEQRMLVHRQRLVDRGIKADALQPQWCMQYQDNCPLVGGYF